MFVSSLVSKSSDITVQPLLHKLVQSLRYLKSYSNGTCDERKFTDLIVTCAIESSSHLDEMASA